MAVAARASVDEESVADTAVVAAGGLLVALQLAAGLVGALRARAPRRAAGQPHSGVAALDDVPAGHQLGRCSGRRCIGAQLGVTQLAALAGAHRAVVRLGRGGRVVLLGRGRRGAVDGGLLQDAAAGLRVHRAVAELPALAARRAALGSGILLRQLVQLHADAVVVALVLAVARLAHDGHGGNARVLQLALERLLRQEHLHLVLLVDAVEDVGHVLAQGAARTVAGAAVARLVGDDVAEDVAHAVLAHVPAVLDLGARGLEAL